MLKLLVAILLIFVSCSVPEKELKEEQLGKSLTTLDNLLRKEQFNYNIVKKALLDVESNFPNSEHKSFNNGMWETEATFKFNSDSSIVMINSNKKSKNGFKREAIICFKDSILLVDTFEVLTEANDTLGYELLETFDYLTPSKNIKTLMRRAFPKPLTDTVLLKKLPFEVYSSNVEKHYPSKLEYVQRIMNRN